MHPEFRFQPGRRDLIRLAAAMPPAIAAVVEGRMFARVRNSSSRIHSGAIVAGVIAARGSNTGLPIPKRIVIDGPIVTKTNAAGMLWLEEQFLI